MIMWPTVGICGGMRGRAAALCDSRSEKRKQGTTLQSWSKIQISLRGHPGARRTWQRYKERAGNGRSFEAGLSQHVQLHPEPGGAELVGLGAEALMPCCGCQWLQSCQKWAGQVRLAYPAPIPNKCSCTLPATVGEGQWRHMACSVCHDCSGCSGSPVFPCLLIPALLSVDLNTFLWHLETNGVCRLRKSS